MTFKNIVLAASISAFASGAITSQSAIAKDICSNGRTWYNWSENGKIKEGCFTTSQMLKMRPGDAVFFKPGYNSEFEAEKRERLIHELEKGPNPKKGKVYSYQEAKKLCAVWDDKKIDALIVEMDGNLNDAERNVIRGALKNWPIVKFYTENIGVDPRLVWATIDTESQWKQQYGSSGERGFLQVFPPTGKLLAKGKAGRYKYYDGSKPWDAGDNPIIAGIFKLDEGTEYAGCRGISFDKMSAEQKMKVYQYFNGPEKGEATWQIANFVNAASNRMWVYEFVEKKLEAAYLQIYVAKEFKRLNKEGRDRVVTEGVQQPVKKFAEQKPVEWKLIQNSLENKINIKPSEIKIAKKPEPEQIINSKTSYVNAVIQPNKPGSNQLDGDIKQLKMDLEEMAVVLNRMDNEVNLRKR